MKLNTPVFCTLLDIGYIDKVIALYESMLNVMDCFKLYIFAFDEKTYDILFFLDLKYVEVIKFSKIESIELKELRLSRSKTEYMWTTTPIIIEHVLEFYKEKECTYIDADIYFFNSPLILIDEMKMENKDVLIIGHRFPMKVAVKKELESGKYCVQFNTFVNNHNGRKVLEWWKNKTIEACFYSKKGDVKGDQKYLESFEKLFDGIHVLKNLGGGVAPWNIERYKLVNYDSMILSEDNQNFELIFFHFQNIRYLPFKLVNINSFIKNKDLLKSIYFPYLEKTESIRKKLMNSFDLNFSMKKSYYNNKVLSFIQNYIMPFRLRNIRDLISLNKFKS